MGPRAFPWAAADVPRPVCCWLCDWDVHLRCQGQPGSGAGHGDERAGAVRAVAGRCISTASSGWQFESNGRLASTSPSALPGFPMPIHRRPGVAGFAACSASGQGPRAGECGCKCDRQCAHPHTRTGPGPSQAPHPHRSRIAQAGGDQGAALWSSLGFKWGGLGFKWGGLGSWLLIFGSHWAQSISIAKP